MGKPVTRREQVAARVMLVSSSPNPGRFEAAELLSSGPSVGGLDDKRASLLSFASVS